MLIPELYNIFKQHPVVTTDSRVCPDGAIFFALKGPSFNGNNYAKSAIEKGCSYAVVDEWNEDEVRPEHIILVDDVLTSLQQLANYHRKTFKTPVIAITGTNGKTTTKELTAAVLSKEFKVLYTKGNFNNHIGVPLTLLTMTKEHEIAVIEMGASHPGDIKELCEIAEPNFGLITNVGVAHIEGFESAENVVKTKKELFDYLEKNDGKVFFNNALKDVISLSDQTNVNAFGRDDSSLFVSGFVLANYPYLEFQWQFFEHKHQVKTHLIGDYNLDNALAAITIGRFFGVNHEFINDALESYIPKNNRSQFEKTEKNTLVIDAYNANPTSMKAALDSFVNFPISPKALILGEMRELGGVSKAEHQQLVDLIDAYSFTKVYLVGSSFKDLKTNFPVYDNVGQLIEELASQPLLDHCILIKGSNGVQLDKVVDIL
jgi:UDP-N-acetylmuramoyl-tripeptide--D-alanyl-D-alanine ligase